MNATDMIWCIPGVLLSLLDNIKRWDVSTQAKLWCISLNKPSAVMLTRSIPENPDIHGEIKILANV